MASSYFAVEWHDGMSWIVYAVYPDRVSADAERRRLTNSDSRGRYRVTSVDGKAA